MNGINWRQRVSANTLWNPLTASAGNGAGDRAEQRQKKQRFELMRFNAVLLSSSAAYLVKALIPRGGLTVVWGPRKCGKSFWTFDLAMHVARGEPYRGRRVQRGVVVYLALEGGNGFRARIEAYRRTHNVDDAPFYLMTDRTDLVKDHEAASMAAGRPARDRTFRNRRAACRCGAS